MTYLHKMEIDLNTIAMYFNDKSSVYHLPKDKFRALIRQRLYDRVKNKKTIFLDLKFWVGFRMALNGENRNNSVRDQQLKQIYKKLTYLTSSGKVECLISSSLIDEMEKMSIGKRTDTARIIDELGCSIVLNNLNVCMMELQNLHLLENGKAPQKEYHLSCIFETNPFLSQSILSKSIEHDFINNIVFAELFSHTLQEYLIATDSKMQNSSKAFEYYFNLQKSGNNKIYSYRQLLVDGLQAQFQSIEDMFNLNSGITIPVGKRIDVIIKNAPFLYLFSAIHAAMELDKDRIIKSNDFFDLSHSCIGVGYTDYFFTEKSFHHLLTSKPIDCGSHFKTRIYSKVEDIMSLLNSF